MLTPLHGQEDFCSMRTSTKYQAASNTCPSLQAYIALLLLSISQTKKKKLKHRLPAFPFPCTLMACSASTLPLVRLMTCSVTHTVSFSLPLLNLSHPASTPGHTENEQPSLVWFDRGKFYLTFEGKQYIAYQILIFPPLMLFPICIF